MSLRSSLFLLGITLLVAVAPSCNIDTCEGGYCEKGEDGREDGDRQCATYCARLSLCQAPQSADFDECVGACQRSFEQDRQRMAELCVCAEHSDCRDMIAERCPSVPGAGGSSGANTGGLHAGGNAGSPADGSSAGGSAGSSVGGSGGSSVGGSGGSSVGGSGGSSGSSCGTGGASGSNGSAGSGQQTPCARDCDCPLPERCIAGYCAPA
jgi:hypothetical protein